MLRFHFPSCVLTLFVVLTTRSGTVPSALAADQPISAIRVAADGNGFSTVRDNRPFVPWGFNYDHDRDGRLLEDYWFDDWESVAAAPAYSTRSKILT